MVNCAKVSDVVSEVSLQEGKWWICLRDSLQREYDSYIIKKFKKGKGFHPKLITF